MARATVEREAGFKRLLYEQGQKLERVVWEALRDLGAEVVEPARAGVEDGRLTDPKGRRAMLEIKGRSGQLRLADVRQLDTWTRNAIATEDWTGRGILIANLQIDLPPDERSDTVAPNALNIAETFGVCIVPTQAIYNALREQQQGAFDAEAWWDSIFETSGMLGG